MTEQRNYEARRAELRQMFQVEDAGPSDGVATGGVHHLALICSDMEATIRFYTEVLEMRLNRIVQNRDEPSSTHIFLDMGGGNQLAFFDFPSLGPQPTVRGIGSMHHVAIKAEPARYKTIVQTLKKRGIAHSIHGNEDLGSVYLHDPDNILVEITTGY